MAPLPPRGSERDRHHRHQRRRDSSRWRSRRDDAGAAAALERLLADQKPSEQAYPVDVARSLDALGCSALVAGRAGDALRHFDEAARRYAKRLPDAHPLRLRSEALRALADGTAPAAAAATARYRKTFAADSPLRLNEPTDCRSLL